MVALSIGRSVSCVWFASMVSALAAADSSRVPPLAPLATPPLPAAAAFAAARGLPLAGLDITGNTGSGRSGDSIVSLVTVHDKTGLRQWLIQSTSSAMTDAERATHPPKQVTFNSRAGRAYAFEAGAGMALDVATFGPFDAGHSTPPQEKHARAFLSPDLLAIGLDRSCQAMLQLVEERRRHVDAGASSASEAPLSADEERSAIGFAPALLSFFQTVQDTPGLREILWDVIEKPSVWSLVKHGGRVDANLSLNRDSVAALPPGEAGGPASPGYRLSFILVLNDTPALVCSLFVTAPHPPLLLTAGIMSIVAESPVDPDKQIEVRVVSARRATAPPGGGSK